MSDIITFVGTLMDKLDEAVNWDYFGFLTFAEQSRRLERYIKEVLEEWGKNSRTYWERQKRLEDTIEKLKQRCREDDEQIDCLQEMIQGCPELMAMMFPETDMATRCCGNCCNHSLGAGPADDGYIFCENDKATHPKEDSCALWGPEKGVNP